MESQRFVGPVVMEQSTHYYPIDFHAADLARLEWALYDATGDPSYERPALWTLTHYLDEGPPADIRSRPRRRLRPFGHRLVRLRRGGVAGTE